MTGVLLVDSNSTRRAALKVSLQAHGLRVIDTNLAHGISRMDLSLLDCVVSNAEALDDLPGKLPCILLDYEGDARRAVDAMKRGVADYLVAPFEPEAVLAAIEECRITNSHTGPLNMVGSSPPMTELFERIAKAGPTDSAILIHGESGTGKELVARALHAASTRNQAPMITLNCATTPQQLVESELFGYPDASPSNFSRMGLLQAANGGTLLLDEVGELPTTVQARLRQVLDEGTVWELGTGTAHRVDVRLIATTHRNLRALIENGMFREDFFYQINVVTLSIPPLRERGQDIIHIAELFLDQMSKKLARPCRGLSDSARKAMLHYDWPGNVRELENAIERAVILCNDAEIDETLLAIDTTRARSDHLASATPDQTSLEDYFVSFVTANEDQLTETELAQKLGISRKSLWERRQRLNIPRKRTKKRGPRRDTS